MAEEITIQVVADPVCPWCYIGKQRLDRALASRPGLTARITWLPYQLSPDLPREGVDRLEHYAGIFGAERAGEIVEQTAATARAEGLEFRMLPGARSPNTLSAHVLLYWAARDPAIDQHELAGRLCAAHHEACVDIGDHEVLAEIAAEAGMDPDTVRAGLGRGDDEDAVRALIGEAARAGVGGVPFFIFNGRYGVSGAQPVEALAEVLDRLAEIPEDAAGGTDRH